MPNHRFAAAHKHQERFTSIERPNILNGPKQRLTIETVFDDGTKCQLIGKQFVTLFGEKPDLKNWFEVVRARQNLSAPAEAGVKQDHPPRGLTA